MNNVQALIYADSGVNARSLKETKRQLSLFGIQSTPVTAQEVIEGSLLEKCSLFVLPGGADIFYAEKLNGRGNENLRHFVLNGGTFLGICAGSYYGGASIQFAAGEPIEVIGKRELGFFPGCVKGPAFAGFVYESHKGAHAAYLTGKLMKRRGTIYCNGGGYFDDAERYSQVEVLAQFDELEGRPAAIVSCHVGKGRALLSSVHFEYAPENLLGCSLENVLPRLEESKLAREELLNGIKAHLFDSCKIRGNCLA